MKIRAYETDDDRLIATTLEEEDKKDDLKLKGPVEPGFTYDSESGQITIVGLAFTIENGVTEFEGAASDYNAFFSFLSANEGTVVNVKDKYPWDGVADSAEIEDEDEDDDHDDDYDD